MGTFSENIALLRGYGLHPNQFLHDLVPFLGDLNCDENRGRSLKTASPEPFLKGQFFEVFDLW